MRTIWALALLGLVLLVPLASAGDVASSEASGVLGVGAENEDDDDDDDQGEDLQTLTSESQDSKVVDLSLVLVIVVLLIPALLVAGLLWLRK
jgi:hypothetical protein